MGEVRPVVVRPGGELRVLSIRDAIKLKSYLGTATPVSSEESDRILNDVTIPLPSAYRRRSEYHRMEVFRRKNGVFKAALGDLAGVFGYDTLFSTQTPEFIKICNKYQYAPGSLAGTLVKYGFIVQEGYTHVECRSNRYSKVRVYRVVKPQH